MEKLRKRNVVSSSIDTTSASGNRPQEPAAEIRDGVTFFPKGSGDASERPSTLRVWAVASRPHTLTASIAPVLVGSCLAPLASPFAAPYVLSNCLLFATFACLVQLGTNLHNDYADFVKGADDERRVGQARATQRGWLTPAQTAGGATVTLVAASAIGLYLTISAGRASGTGSVDPTFTITVATSVFNAVAYTGGPYPLGYVGLGDVSIGYSGLGDVFVFLYFGIVATLGVPYLCLRSAGDGRPTSELLFLGDHAGGSGESGGLLTSLLASVPVGFLATAIIVVNNLRDRKTDVGAGKRTTAVRFGESFARAQYAALAVGSYGALPFLAYGKNRPFLWLLPLLSAPVAIPQLRAVAMGGKDGADLNDHVGGTAQLQLLYCFLLCLGVWLESW